jgi:hypothetical protein
MYGPCILVPITENNAVLKIIAGHFEQSKMIQMTLEKIFPWLYVSGFICVIITELLYNITPGKFS